ncbi:MAG: class I SAM-dependent methyltransferase [Rhodocyclales bacterium]|nr:class I SAM-dependent methyltransferase [Rhodocyclales bacterium]
MSEKEIRHLESITPFYQEGDAMDRLLIDREMDIVRRYCPGEGKCALEVGCGDGYSTQHLAELFPDLEVIEPSQGNIALLRQRVPAVPCHNVLLEDFRTTRKYDYIFFLNVIEHVEDPVAALKQCAALLRDEGSIFISAPNCMSLNRRAGFHMGLLESYDTLAPKDLRVGHRRLYTTRMLEDHCDQAGLRVQEMKGLYLKPLSEKQMIEMGDAVVRAFHLLGEDIPEYCACLLAIAAKKHY